MKIHLLLLAPLLWLSGCASNMVQGYDINELRNRMGDRTLVIRMAPDEVLPIEVDSSSQEDYADDIENAGLSWKQFESLIRTSMCERLEFGLPKTIRWETTFPGTIDSFVFQDSSAQRTVFFGDTSNLKSGELALLRSTLTIGLSREFLNAGGRIYTPGATLGSFTISHEYILKKFIRATFAYSIYDPRTQSFLMHGYASDRSQSLGLFGGAVSKSDWIKSSKLSATRLVDDLSKISR